MSKVNFIFDKNKDLYNIWETASKKQVYGHDFSKNMPSNLVSQIENKSFKEAKPIISKYFANVYSSGLISISLNADEKAWRKVEKEYFKRMDKLFGKKLSAKKIIARMTLAPRCPYDPDEKSFMIQFYGSIPATLSTCAHEIMHLYFHEHYFAKVEKELGKEEAHKLKEAMTVLLNTSFMDLLFMRDRGYESHADLRTFILSQWKKDINFERLIETCVKKLKSEKLK